jgi:UDP-N-acetylglucosamine 2-epimerase
MHRLGVQAGQFVLTTVHRAENTDTPGRLQAILQALLDMNEAIVFPVHPRTRNRIAHLDAAFQQRLAASQIQMIEPVGYLEMVALEQSARMILTDSGGIQKEAYWLGIPCITLRDETEWIETVQHGWNIVVGADTARIVEAARHWTPPTTRPPLYGEGEAVQQCIARLEHAHRDSGR